MYCFKWGFQHEVCESSVASSARCGYTLPPACAQPFCESNLCIYRTADTESCKAKQVRQVRSGPQVTSTQGNVVVEVADGKQVGYKIGDEDVIMLDEVPDALRAYTGA